MWPFKKQRTKVMVIRRDRCELTLAQWQSNPDYTKAGTALLNDQYLKLVLDMLRNSHPGWMVLPFDIDLQARAAHQAKCEGYTMALANLEAIGTNDLKTEPLESSYVEEETAGEK